MPCLESTVCRYIVFLARTLSANSIPSDINIIRLIHLEMDLPNPLLSFKIKSLLIKGVKRVRGLPPKQKLPITLDILRQMHSVLDLSDNFHKAIWAAALIAFLYIIKEGISPSSFSKWV